MNELRLKAYDYAAEWKAKYESWRKEIPEARILNLKHGLKLDSVFMDRIAAQKSRYEAEKKAREAEARTKKVEWQLNFLRRNLEAKMEAMDVPHGFACLQTSLQSWDYHRATEVI